MIPCETYEESSNGNGSSSTITVTTVPTALRSANPMPRQSTPSNAKYAPIPAAVSRAVVKDVGSPWLPISSPDTPIPASATTTP